MMKRKADDSIDGAEGEGSRKRAAINPLDIDQQENFRQTIFGQELDELKKRYSESKPYKHGVIKDLISPGLLRNVRSEIQKLSFTVKETDLYRIHQSGDLANLDGLEDSSLKLLPSLLVLRDALYSSRFRNYLSQITQAGPLSGKKTDMAINVYTPGCHLLCHDDVIGSRRVSYILYLTDPDQPWKEEWGGALRLYPTYPISNNQPNAIAGNHSTPIAEDHSTLVAEDHSTPVAEHHSTPIAEDHSIPIAKDHSAPIAKDHSTPLAEDHSTPIAEDHSTPIAEDHSKANAENHSKSIAEDRSDPNVDDPPTQIAEDRSKLIAEDQSNPNVEDPPTQIAEDRSKLIAEDQSDPNVEDQPNSAAANQSLKAPLPDPTVSIPPAFNQLSFFAVQPGESFHDVEEVLSSDDKTDETRVRMAISGWYHIPQEGDDGYIEGLELETKLAEKSSRTQLQKRDSYDLPSAAKTRPIHVDESFGSSTDQDEKKSLVIDSIFSDDDLNFLIKYIQPTYLTPDALESAANFFSMTSFLTLTSFLSEKFSDSLREYIVRQESHVLPASTTKIESTTPWKVARPPHKHRFLYLEGGGKKNIKDQSPLQDLLENLLPSYSFHKWLQLATGSVISSHNLLARRFRRGKDYTLATRCDEEDFQLELTLAITPTSGWEAEGSAADQTEAEEGTDRAKEHTGSDQEHTASDEWNQVDDGGQTAGDKEDEIDHSQFTDGDVGGYVSYRVDDEEESKDFDEVASTGDQGKRPKSDPAVYRTANDEDDSTLFQIPAAWNRMDIVLRDPEVMRFVKYVNHNAPGDRWDICGEFSVILSKDDEQEEEEDEEDDDMTQKSGADGDNGPNSTLLEDTDELEMMKSETETSDDY